MLIYYADHLLSEQKEIHNDNRAEQRNGHMTDAYAHLNSPYFSFEMPK